MHTFLSKIPEITQNTSKKLKVLAKSKTRFTENKSNPGLSCNLTGSHFKTLSMSEMIFISDLGFLPMINNKSRRNVQGPYLPKRTPKKRKKHQKHLHTVGK